MVETPKPTMPAWALPALSWLVSFYFLLGFVVNVGFPPDRALFSGDALYVFLWLFFLFLPFFSKIKIGKIIELEREVAQTKEDLNAFKSEMRTTVSVLSTNVNTIGGMTNQVTVNMPGASELREARLAIDSHSSLIARADAPRVERSISLEEDDDTTMALARTRIEIERLLRSILGKRPVTASMDDEPIKFAGANRLFKTFVHQHNEFEYLIQPFDVVNRVCNAAVHAQRVPDKQAREALNLGATIIAVLEDFAKKAK